MEKLVDAPGVGATKSMMSPNISRPRGREPVTIEKGDTSAPVTVCECARPINAGGVPVYDGELSDEPSMTVRLPISGIDRVFRSFLGPDSWLTATCDFTDDMLPLLNIEGGRNACMLILERR